MRALVMATVALAALPAAASADSIAFVRGGDIHLVTADGGREFRVTATGGYTDVTQADDGTMIGLHGVRLHRLDRSGRVLADFATPVSDTRPEGQRVFYGPFDPAISPDGTKLSYTYLYVGKGTAPGCTPPTCMTTVTEGGTGYSHADRQTDWDEPGLGRHSGWRNATWLDDETTMISDPTHLPNADVLLDVVGDQGVPIMDWFSDNGTDHLGGGAMDAQRTKLAFQAGQGDSGIRVYRMPGPYPQLPQACYAYADPAGGAVGTPTFSPDGRRLAWTSSVGDVVVVDVPDLAGGCTTAGASPEARVLIRDGSQPDWGPAGVPAGQGRKPEARPDTTTGTTTATTPQQPQIPTPRSSLRVTGRSASYRRGIRLRATLPGTGRLSARATAGRAVLARSATVQVTGAGERSITLGLTPAGRSHLKRARSRKATLTVTFTPAGKAAQQLRRSITIKGGGR